MTRWLRVGLTGILVALIVLLGVTTSVELGVEKGKTGGSQMTITIGSGDVLATSVPDYTCDGVADNVQFVLALAALPPAGGRLVVLAGTYVFATGVNVPANITIEGMGRSTIITRDNLNPVFTTTGSGCIFANFSTDDGGINLGATTGWEERNILLGMWIYK